MWKRFKDREHLPHPTTRPGHVFMTWRVHPTAGQLAAGERDIVMDVLCRTPMNWCDLIALVVMDDHVHLVCDASGTKSVGQLAQAWKSISAHAIVHQGLRKAPIWQAEYFDRAIRDDRQLSACIRYVLENPDRRWPGIKEYKWVADLRPPPDLHKFFQT